MIFSCNGANFVARQVEYKMVKGWMEGNDAAEAWFRPPSTFKERFSELVVHIRTLGFTAFDIWTAQLNWAWATEEHIASAKEVFGKNGVRITSYAGPFGGTADEFRRAANLIKRFDCPILGGSAELLSSGKSIMAKILKETEAIFAFENHPDEDTPEDTLDRIAGLPEAVSGICMDTGWFGTHNYDAVKACKLLLPRLRHVHLKDVREPGQHRTCRYGDGVVDIEGVVRTLKNGGYAGAISVEHEPDDYDPSEELRENLSIVKKMWG